MFHSCVFSLHYCLTYTSLSLSLSLSLSFSRVLSPSSPSPPSRPPRTHCGGVACPLPHNGDRDGCQLGEVGRRAAVGWRRTCTSKPFSSLACPSPSLLTPHHSLPPHSSPSPLSPPPPPHPSLLTSHSSLLTPPPHPSLLLSLLTPHSSLLTPHPSLLLLTLSLLLLTPHSSLLTPHPSLLLLTLSPPPLTPPPHPSLPLLLTPHSPLLSSPPHPSASTTDRNGQGNDGFGHTCRRLSGKDPRGGWCQGPSPWKGQTYMYSTLYTYIHE